MDQLSIFGESLPVNGDPLGQLNIVYARFERTEAFSMTLFDGFDSMRVLTYSSSIGMTLKMLDRFEDVECVFGYEGVLGDISDVIAFQKTTADDILLTTNAMDDMRKHRIIEAMKANQIRFYIVKDAISHSKVYLLEGEDKHRVIVGSANLSDRAFSGKQAETLVVFDDDPAAWDFYTNEYQIVKEKSTSELNLPDLKVVEVKLEQVPILVHAEASDKGIEVFINTDTRVCLQTKDIER